MNTNKHSLIFYFFLYFLNPVLISLHFSKIKTALFPTNQSVQLSEKEILLPKKKYLLYQNGIGHTI